MCIRDSYNIRIKPHNREELLVNQVAARAAATAEAEVLPESGEVSLETAVPVEAETAPETAEDQETAQEEEAHGDTH